MKCSIYTKCILPMRAPSTSTCAFNKGISTFSFLGGLNVGAPLYAHDGSCLNLDVGRPCRPLGSAHEACFGCGLRLVFSLAATAECAGHATATLQQLQQRGHDKLSASSSGPRPRPARTPTTPDQQVAFRGRGGDTITPRSVACSAPSPRGVGWQPADAAPPWLGHPCCGRKYSVEWRHRGTANGELESRSTGPAGRPHCRLSGSHQRRIHTGSVEGVKVALFAYF